MAILFDKNIKQISVDGTVIPLEPPKPTFYQLLTNTVDEDIDITIPDETNVTLGNIVTNNHNLIIRGNWNWKGGSSGWQAGSGNKKMIYFPDTTGTGWENYAPWSGSQGFDRINLPEFLSDGGTVLFHSNATIKYVNLPKLQKVNQNYQHNLSSLTVWYFPSATQINAGSNHFGTSKPKAVILGQSNCTLGSISAFSTMKSYLQDCGVFVPTGSIASFYSTATNWSDSTIQPLLHEYDEVSVSKGTSTTLSGATTYELYTQWYDEEGYDTPAVLSDTTLTFNYKGRVFVRFKDSNGDITGGTLYIIGD